MSTKHSRANLPETEQKVNFTDTQLHDALMWIQDHIERTGAPFVVLGDIAKQLHKDPFPYLDADKIEIGIMKRHWTRSTNALSHMRIHRDIEGVTELEYNGVPIEVRIIEGEYPFLKHPDSRFYTLSEFCIPNPFEDYWQVRDTVK